MMAHRASTAMRTARKLSGCAMTVMAAGLLPPPPTPAVKSEDP
jgi:hypothetical protein